MWAFAEAWQEEEGPLLRAALAGEVAREVTELMMGRPDARMLWGARIFGR